MAESEHLNPGELPVKSTLAVAVSMAVAGYADDAQAQSFAELLPTHIETPPYDLRTVAQALLPK